MQCGIGTILSRADIATCWFRNGSRKNPPTQLTHCKRPVTSNARTPILIITEQQKIESQRERQAVQERAGCGGQNHQTLKPPLGSESRKCGRMPALVRYTVLGCVWLASATLVCLSFAPIIILINRKFLLKLAKSKINQTSQCT
jgi:hypothetical protein